MPGSQDWDKSCSCEASKPDHAVDGLDINATPKRLVEFCTKKLHRIPPSLSQLCLDLLAESQQRVRDPSKPNFGGMADVGDLGIQVVGTGGSRKVA